MTTMGCHVNQGLSPWRGELLLADGLHGNLQGPPKPGHQGVPGNPGPQGAPVGQHEQHPVIGAVPGPAAHQVIGIAGGDVAGGGNAQRAKVLQGAVEPLAGTV
jgi:hypothetical protein